MGPKWKYVLAQEGVEQVVDETQAENVIPPDTNAPAETNGLREQVIERLKGSSINFNNPEHKRILDSCLANMKNTDVDSVLNCIQIGLVGLGADDMANELEKFLSGQAMAEMSFNRWHNTPIKSPLGEFNRVMNENPKR